MFWNVCTKRKITWNPSLPTAVCTLFSAALTLHPDGHVRAAVVPAGALGRHEVARRRVEPVPAGAQAPVAHGRLAAAEAQVVVERALRLIRNQLQNKSN